VTRSISGIHHVTCITGDVQKNVDFYVSVLGLRFVKKSVNQDVPDTYHLYFADYVGSPGTAMTFFGWPTWPAQRTGSGQVTRVAFSVPEKSLNYWEKRLKQHGVVSDRSALTGTELLEFEDADGISIQLVPEPREGPYVPWESAPVPADAAILGFHSVSLSVADAAATTELLTQTMGFRQVDAGGHQWMRFETGGGGPGAIVDVIEMPDGPRGEESIGTVHHVAWRARDDAEQKAWREALIKAGRDVTPVIDRWYFKSIYYREPGGVLFEIATDGPGFTVDEKPEALGSSLSLPPWFDVKRDELDRTLTPIVVPADLVQGRASSQ
jgi:glyoxalase family protein